MSVDHRYGASRTMPEYAHKMDLHGHPEPVATLKAIDCYEYQSCEHKQWPSSEAFKFCEALRSTMIHALPGYDDAKWAIHA